MKDTFDIPSHPIPSHPTPSHPIKLALRARRVNPALDPGESGKELIGKGSGIVRARLATVRARLATVRARLATERLKEKKSAKQNIRKSLNLAKKIKGGGGNFTKEIPLNEISE